MQGFSPCCPALNASTLCSRVLHRLIRNAWFFLLAARHRMQALSALACCVGCTFGGFASLKTALFIHISHKRGCPLYFWGTLLWNDDRVFLIAAPLRISFLLHNLKVKECLCITHLCCFGKGLFCSVAAVAAIFEHSL